MKAEEIVFWLCVVYLISFPFGLTWLAQGLMYVAAMVYVLACAFARFSYSRWPWSDD